MAGGPYLRTASRYPNRPDTTPPARQIREKAASAAMKAFVSTLTSPAVPGPVITSSARGATAAQPNPAATPHTTVPATTASEATTARERARPRPRARLTSPPPARPGSWNGSDMVAQQRTRPRPGAGTEPLPLAWAMPPLVLGPALRASGAAGRRPASSQGPPGGSGGSPPGPALRARGAAGRRPASSQGRLGRLGFISRYRRGP